MKVKNHLVLGAVGALFLLGSALAVTGGRGVSIQGTFLQSGTGAQLRTIESKLRDELSVKDFGCAGDDSTDDSTCLAAARDAAVTSGRTIVFPPGTYKYATSPNWVTAGFPAANGLRLVGGNGVTLHFTGTGNAVIFDVGSGAQSGVNGIQMDGFLIKGNASATNGLFLRGVHRSVFRNIRVTDVSASGLLTNFAVANTYDTFRVSNNEAAFVTQPVNGILLDQRSASEQTTASTFITPIIEGVSGTGIKLVNAKNCTFLAGTSEGNARGMEIGDGADRNVVEDMDFEANTIEDVLINGNDNQILYLLAASTGAQGTLHFSGAGCLRNAVIGGVVNNITIDAGANINRFVGVTYNLYGTGAFTDNGTSTVRLDVTNKSLGFSDTVVLPSLSVVGNAANSFGGGTSFFNAVKLKRTDLTYGATIATDLNAGNFFTITATNTSAFTVSNPTNLSAGQYVVYMIKNSSGGALGAITWGSAGLFKMNAAAIAPANGQGRSIGFLYDGVSIIEMWRGANDIPN